MIFSDEQYNINSLFVYNNDYYATLKVVGNKKIASVKDPNGNIVYETVFGNTNIAIKSVASNEIPTTLTEILESEVTLVDIIQTTPSTPPEGVPTWQITGKIVDEEGNPIEANLDFNLVQILETPQLVTSLTNEKGEAIGSTNLQAAVVLTTTCSFDGTFILSYTETPEEGTFDFSNSSVTISAPDFIPISKGNPILKSGEISQIDPISGVEGKINSYDLGRISLQPLVPKKQIKKLEEQLVQAQDKFEATQAEIQAIVDLPFESKIALLFDTFKERIKRTIISYLVNILSEFGAKTLAEIQQGLEPSPEICPDKDKLKEIIKKRNRIVRELNNIYSIVKKIDSTLTLVNGIIIALKVGLTIASTLPAPPFTPPGAVASTIDKIRKALINAGAGVSILTVSVAVVGNLLGTVLELLKFQIQTCAPGSDLSFDEINEELNALSQPTIQSLENTNTDVPLTYKGFTFEIKFDDLNQTPYPKRFAQALNIQNIPVLRGESSFASDPQVLIDELKFIIDTQNLRAD